jgi:hypothetical protein
MIAIGAQFYPAGADSERRQARARAALLALDGAIPINLQFADEDYRLDGFRTLRVLRQDSRTVTGAGGLRKPIVSEMFSALAEAARESGCRYFAYLNSDIEVTPAALAPLLAGDLDGCAFSRIDIDPATRAELGVEICGLDMFAVDAAWWAREAHRFRPYIAGEPCWDNVYTSILCAHGRGNVINERPGIYHERHAARWSDGPFAQHNGFLAALDSPYFSRWTVYVHRLEELRKTGAPVDGRELVQATLGNPRLSPRDAAVQAGRQLRARVRYAWTRATRPSKTWNSGI